MRFVLTAALAAAALSFPTVAQSQIIDEDTTFPAQRVVPHLGSGFEAFADIRHGTNALSASNLPGGFDEKAERDTLFVKGLTGQLAYPFGNNLGLVAGLSLSHINYFKNSQLNFFGTQANAGVLALPGRALQLFAGGNCSGEFDTKLRSYYKHCGPVAVAAVTVGSPNGFHATLSGRGYLALGDRDRFARYREASVRLSLRTGGKLRLSVEPGANVRSFTSPSLFSGFDYKRRDITASVPVSLGIDSGRLRAAIVVEPSATWSTIPFYRHWDLRAGPSIGVRF